jgi:NADH-quinone oxidoreductase subunit J
MYSEPVFYMASFLILIFGMLTLACRNIFYSLLSAIIVFFMAAVLFFLLNSEYNAVIQIAVYGFAIPIILGLGIMFTNLRKDKPVKIEFSNSKYAMILVGGIFILAVIYIILISLVSVPEIFSTQIIFEEAINQHSNFTIFAKGIYSKYVLAFELVSIILTIAAAGLTVIKRVGRKVK